MWFSQNWMLVVACLCLLAAGILAVLRYTRLPRDKQLKNIKKWLLWAVCAAEKSLGGGTGQLKLAMVYDLFIAKFPAVAAAMPFSQFAGLVDEALNEMKRLLSSNKAVASVILQT